MPSPASYTRVESPSPRRRWSAYSPAKPAPTMTASSSTRGAAPAVRDSARGSDMGPPSPSGLRMDHRLGAADDERLVALEEVGDHFDERLRAPGADGVPRRVDEDEVAVGYQLLVDASH